jgi:hypothetical protein
MHPFGTFTKEHRKLRVKLAGRQQKGEPREVMEPFYERFCGTYAASIA